MVTTWGIHNDQASIDPVHDGAVRIGWDEVGDLSHIDPSRDAFKAAVRERMPSVSEGTLPSAAGTLYRFVHEVRDGDIVVCPDRKRRTLNIGRVTGEYEFRPGVENYKHWRPVTWVRTGVARTELSVAAQQELGSATTLFTVSTAEAEIGHLLAAPARDDAPDFGWTAFYPRLIDAFLDFADDRGVLLEKLWNVAQTSGRPKLFKYLQADRYRGGGSGPLRDVDPFTVLGTFNRGILDAARADIAAAFGREFDVSPPYPEHFPGVPLVNNLASWFVKFEEERDERSVDRLWDLCAAAVADAEGSTEDTRERLVSAFDACATGNTTKLTMGLFWARPEHFAAYDSRTSQFLKAIHPQIAASLALGSRIDGEQFLSNTQILRTWVADPASPFRSFAELSFAAWLYAPESESIPEVPPARGPVVIPPPVGEAYSTESIREDGGFVAVAQLDTMLERLRAKKNIILQGPPGTGKTWLARRLGWALCDERGSDRVSVVQFHPGLTYEDFVRGWRPSGTGLDLIDGTFLELCTRAVADPEQPHILVVEEANRGNPAQIFGELLTLLEADKRSSDSGMKLAYSRGDERFHVPENVYLIGTMNVADRSLAIVDMALRRRFAFIELEPSFGDDWMQHVSGLGYDLDLLEVYGSRLRNLNDAISADGALGRQYCIGHSFFTPATRLEDTGLTTQQWWQRVVDTDVRPLLEEYWFDRPALAIEYGDLLLGA